MEKLRDFSKKKHSMFDELVKSVEKIPSIPKEVPMYIKHTKIFNFDASLCFNIDGLKTTNDQAAEQLLQGFYDIPLEKDRLGLPFPNTCIVTPDAACMLNAIEGQERAYVYTLLVHMHNKTDMVWLCSGLVICPEIVTKVQDLRMANAYFYCKKQNGKFALFTPRGNKYDASMVSPIIGKAMSLIMQLNTPDRFILEVTPIKTDIRSNKYIPRSHQRPEYILLHPHVIRKYMKTESDTEGHKRRGHERRAHLRTYPDDPIRFPNAHGKVVQIPALWVGRTEAVVDDRQYKVILD